MVRGGYSGNLEYIKKIKILFSQILKMSNFDAFSGQASSKLQNFQTN